MKGRWLPRRERVDDGSPSTTPGVTTEPTITGEFAALVREDPYHPAIVGVPKPLTYGELAWLAEGYRALVADRGGSPLDRVALLLPHDASVVAAALGALSNRMSVIVLNPSDPPSRLAQICEDVQPILLLADEAYAEQAASVAPPCAEVLVPGQGGFRTEVVSLPPLLGDGADPGDVAFLISTSGSTGRPKLVTQSHRNMVHNAFRYSKGLGIRADDRIAWSVSMSGGQGLATVWTALLTGAALCPYSLTERGIVGLASWMQTVGVTVFDTLPTVFRNLVRTLDEGRILSPRLVRLASEAAFQADFEMFRQHFASTATLATVWGSSEAGITAQGLFTTADAPPPGRLSVGREAEGIEIVLVDDEGDEVPDGAEGRVVVRSRYLSPGYWGDDRLTEARVTDGPYGPQLLTGDLARRAADGSLFVTGRSDSQVKVRGHRLHLEEVEAAIVRHPEVKDARVVPRTHSNGDVTLSAFVVGRPDAALDGPAVQRSLRQILPGYSVPTTFVVVDSLPLTAHGKVDRDALLRLVPAPAIPGSPDSEIEEVLADLWRDAFDRDDVDVEQPFLTAGGDSLAATVIAAGIHDIFGIELGLGVFAGDPTVSELARLINDQRATGVVTVLHEIEKVPRRGSHPLSSSQLGTWTKASEDPSWPVLAWPFDIRGDLDVTAFNESIVDITRRHEIFRTTFTEVGGVPVARIRTEPLTEFTFRDLRGLDDPDAAASDALRAQAIRPFDPGTGPLLRSELLQLGDRHYRWIRSSHHILSDPTSWLIFLDELRAFYESRVAGESPLRDESPRLQYIDYAEWERDWPTRERTRFDAAVDHWRELFRAAPPHRQLPLGPPSHFDGSPAGLLHWGLFRTVSEQLDGVARAANATYFMSRLAPYVALLAIESPSDDTIIGMSVSMRGRPELRGVIGPITNYGVVRCRDATERTFNEWLRDVRRWVIDLSTYCHVPFRFVGPELRRAGVPVARPQASFASSLRGPIRPFGGLEIQQLPRECPDLQHFRVGVNQAFEEDQCWVEFHLREHNEAAVRRYIERLEAFIAAAASQPDIPLGHLVERLPVQVVRPDVVTPPGVGRPVQDRHSNVGAIATTLESPEATETAPGTKGAAARPRISIRRVRVAGLVVLGIQFFGLAVWSQILCSHFAVGTDFTGYGQAWFLMAHGHLDPYVSSWGEKFLSDHASFIMIPLSAFWWVWPHAVTLLWLQCVAIVVGEGVAFVWMCEVAETLSGRRYPSARHQAGRRAVMVRQLWSWIDPAAVLAVLGLVLLVADPWIYWTASFDVHFEVPAATFALLTAYDLAHLRTRAWLWVPLTALSGDLGITYLFGVGISAVLAGQAWRKKGIILLVAPVAAFGLVDALGLTTGSSVIGKYLTGRPQTGSSNLGGWSKLGHDVVAHPRAYASRLRNHLLNIYGTIAPSGAIGLFCAWGFGVPFVVLVENAFANRVEFSETAFQNFPVYLFVAVGTVMVLARLVLRWPRTSAVLASVILLSTVGWAITWGSKTASSWLRVSHPAAEILNRTLARLPANAEVLASHSVIGPFAERPNLYEFHYNTEPVVTRSVWFIVAPSQGINTESVQSDLARLSWLAGPLGAKLVDHGSGVWVFKLSTSPGVTSADFLDGCPTIPAWAVPGAAGRSDVLGDSARWRALSNGAQGYVVAGDYWRLRAGSYEAAVALRSTGPVSVEVWDADRSQLVARRQLPSTNGATLVTLPFEAPEEVRPAGSEGFGPFRMVFPPAPAHDQLEVRVYSPGHSAVAVSSVTVVPSTLASNIGSIASTVC